ncbi:MAG: HAMP domain-containing histidine kinase [Lachnospiraceae bacterium]|nr:HAMP domain-containing histidine kinase [Lachnospiraceae bacterium]
MQLKNLERMRKDFVANVSHELKTPITSIKGFAETLLDGALKDEQSARSFAAIIKTQSDRMENVIEDLLSLSELESGSSEIKFEVADIISLIKNLCDEYRAKGDVKNISINFSSPLSSCVKKINLNLFRQCCANILENAIKYCPANSRVEVEILPLKIHAPFQQEFLNANSISSPQKMAHGDFAKSENSDEKIMIVFEDDGAGIPEKYSERIFERFFRVDKGRSRETGGTGLGLSIAKHIVEIHGGKIRERKSEKFQSGARFEIMI